jgi:methyl-accepting chemotaxis protein-1 (serine sensor receptor)
MVADCNTLVDAHPGEDARDLDHGRYAVGDLSQDMERLPGEKAVITEALDTAKPTSADQWRDPPPGRSRRRRRLQPARRHARFEHDFRAMVDGLNRLMQTTD